jgi:hypothetical protein
MPFGCCAVVQFNGSAAALARRLMPSAGDGPRRRPRGLRGLRRSILALELPISI